MSIAKECRSNLFCLREKIIKIQKRVVFNAKILSFLRWFFQSFEGPWLKKLVSFGKSLKRKRIQKYTIIDVAEGELLLSKGFFF